MSYSADKRLPHTRTDTQTDAGNDNTRRTKLAPCNKQETCRSIKLRELSACGRFVSHTKATERNCRMTAHGPSSTSLLHQPRLWFITGGYLVKRQFIPAAARARGRSNDLNREILASNLFNCRKEVINVPPVPSISRCIHIVYRHKNVWEYQWSNFIYNCMSTFLHYVHCKDALLDCSAPGGERCESLTWVDEITSTSNAALPLFATRSGVLFLTQAWVLLKWKFTQVHI